MENLEKYDRRLPMKVKVGFGIANLGDTIITEFVGAFLIFFLTNIAGIRPALAGTIVFIGVIWDAISDPIIGTMSDRCRPESRKKKAVPSDRGRADRSLYHAAVYGGRSVSGGKGRLLYHHDDFLLDGLYII